MGVGDALVVGERRRLGLKRKRLRHVQLILPAHAHDCVVNEVKIRQHGMRVEYGHIRQSDKRIGLHRPGHGNALIDEGGDIRAQKL